MNSIPNLSSVKSSQKAIVDLVSAGFDAAAGDPLGGCEVTPAGYAHMTHMLMPLAEGKIVLVLEGGYSLESTSKSALACVRVLMGEPPGPLDPWRLYASEPTVRVVNKVIDVQSKYWKCCRPQSQTIGIAFSSPVSYKVDAASPAPERLNDIIRAYQSKKAQEKWGMTPLPIAKNDMTNLEDQVFVSHDFFKKKTLVLFIHDSPDVVFGPHAVASNKMDLSDAFLVRSLPE
jgi:histone deacetylase 6